MTGVRVTPGRVVFLALGTLSLAGILAYLRLAFEGADARTAVRLVEEAKVGGIPLGERIENFLPLPRRLCEASAVDGERGRVDVECRDTADGARRLRWRVNVLSGRVVPANGEAESLGKGEDPWSRK